MKRCRVCRLPVLPDGRCEFAADHYDAAENAADLERDTKHLWQER